jgi:hypothetical protein
MLIIVLLGIGMDGKLDVLNGRVREISRKVDALVRDRERGSICVDQDRISRVESLGWIECGNSGGWEAVLALRSDCNSRPLRALTLPLRSYFSGPDLLSRCTSFAAWYARLQGLSERNLRNQNVLGL